MKPSICVPCKQEMQCEQNDFTVNDPVSGGFPATYWTGDKYKCPNCGHEIVTGIISRGLPAEQVKPEGVADSLEFTH